ncbi:unnamed protein product, partial [Darwinula stevensoni]
MVRNSLEETTLSHELFHSVRAAFDVNTGIPSRESTQIIFSSRTHSQLTQVIKELKNTQYRWAKVAVLGSRDQLCINPEVQSEKSNAGKVHMCRAKVQSRTCVFYNNVEKRVQDLRWEDRIMDIEDLVKEGRKNIVCPYYASKNLRPTADIVFMPYNYLLDPKARKSHNIELKGNVVIFDEAHNLEKMCEESASVTLRNSDVALCIEEITQITEYMSGGGNPFSGPTSEVDFSIEDAAVLKAMMLKLEEVLDEISVSNKDSQLNIAK